MIDIVKSGNSILVSSDEHQFPFEEGKISIPLNSVFYVIDESDFVVFKSSANGDILFQDSIAKITINGDGVTKDNLVEKFDAVANGSQGGGGTTYNSITETDDSTRIANQYIDLYGVLSINGESFEENVIANEADPVWSREKNNYYTKDEANSKFVEKPFDPSEGASANTFVYLTFNDGSEPRYDYYDGGVIANSAYTSNTSLETVYIGNGITKIGTRAFNNCTSLTSITILDSVTNISIYAFSNCKNLTSVTIPDSVTSIDEGAFYRCSSVTEVIIGSGVRSVGTAVFRDCTSLTSVTIPNSVKSIGQSAFQDCSNITKITIPDSVTSIDWYAFSNCTKLNEIKVYGTTAPSIERGTFSNVAKVGTLYHPKGSDYSTWKANSYLSGWTFVEFDTRDIEERVDDLDERVTVLEEKKVPTIINVNVDHGQTAYYAYIEGAEKGDICKSKAHRWTEADGSNLLIRPTQNTTATSGIRSYNGDTLMYYWELTNVVKGESATLELYDANYSKVNEVQIDGENGYSVGSVGNRWVAGSDVASANNNRGEYLEYYFDGSNWNLVTDDVILIKGGGGGTASALHYESDEITDGDKTYREMLDINKDDSIYFKRSDDPDGWKATSIGRQFVSVYDADDLEGTNAHSVYLDIVGVHVEYDDADMPSTNIGYGSVTAQQGNAKMTMDLNEGYMGALTNNEMGEPFRGVILQTDGTFNLFVDDATANKSFVYLMNEDGININGNPQPIMQVLTQAEYDALTEKDDNILYIIKG